jgi:DNA-binding response OmpR family regulator
MPPSVPAAVCYARSTVERIAFLTDRSPHQALPASLSLGLDLKTEPLDTSSVSHLSELAPDVVFVDACDEPELAFGVLEALEMALPHVPAVVVLTEDDLERLPWATVADGLAVSGTPAEELRVRLAMLRRRIVPDTGPTLRLGSVSIDIDTYQVSAGGRVLDLTYKEFELLRFLVQHAGRVFTRRALLQEVWGYNFYGGTRTVDVHVRRLRAKLGAEHEALIETIRGVGYRAAEASGGTPPRFDQSPGPP